MIWVELWFADRDYEKNMKSMFCFVELLDQERFICAKSLALKLVFVKLKQLKKYSSFGRAKNQKS